MDFDAAYVAIRTLLLETFATVHSLALQQTIFAAGKAVLEAHPEVAEIKLSCPNKHHFLVDLEPFGLKNPGEVFFAADRPYGLIQATVQREGAADSAGGLGNGARLLLTARDRAPAHRRSPMTAPRRTCPPPRGRDGCPCRSCSATASSTSCPCSAA